MRRILFFYGLILMGLLVACEPESDEATVEQANEVAPPDNTATTENVPVAPEANIGSKSAEKAPARVYVNVPPPPGQVKSCDQAAQAVFLSVAEVQELLSDTTITYVFEYKPDDEGNPNGRYWFWIFSTGQGGMSASTVARYQVEPSDLQVYEYDPVADEAKPVKADKKLRKDVRQYCM